MTNQTFNHKLKISKAFLEENALFESSSGLILLSTTIDLLDKMPAVSLFLSLHGFNVFTQFLFFFDHASHHKKQAKSLLRAGNAFYSHLLPKI